MSEKPTTRRDLMKPVQLLGLAALAAVFAGVVTLVTMGFFQQRPGDQVMRALVIAAIVAGITFIVMLVVLALLLLAVDPEQVTKPLDRPVLLPDDPKDRGERSGESTADDSASGEEPHSGGASRA